MKRHVLLLILAMCLTTLFTACKQNETVVNDTPKTNIESWKQEKEKQYIGLSQLPKDYPSDLAKENGDYVDIHGEIFNEEAMTEFLKDVDNSKTAYIRTVAYTIEGDPIITDFSYNGEKFMAQIDNTRDKYGKSQIVEKEFNNLITYESDNRLYYVITDLTEITEENQNDGFDGITLKYDIIQ